MNTNYVPHVNVEGRDDKQARTCSCLHERSIEVHHPELCLDLCWGEQGVGLFCDEIYQYLGLDGLAGRVGEGFTHELD